MINKVIDFLENMKYDGNTFFIEAEALPSTIDAFIADYNTSHVPSIARNTDGIICLQEDANKWSLELRLYVPIDPPAEIKDLFTRNTVYRNLYKYRLNNNKIIKELFAKGYKIGEN